MKLAPRLALLLCVFAAPASAQSLQADCALVQRISILEDAYLILLQTPEAPQAGEVAYYAQVLTDSFGGNAPPTLLGPLNELAQLALLIQTPGGATRIDPEMRSRQFSNLRQLGNYRSASDCPGASEANGAGSSDGTGSGAAALGGERGSGNGGERPRYAVTDVDLNDFDWHAWIRDLLNPKTLLTAIGIVLLGALGMLVPTLAKPALAAMTKADGGGGGRKKRKSWKTQMVAKIFGKPKDKHHTLGRFFDLVEPETGRRQRMKVADISLGGAKLAWHGAPANGTMVNLDLDGIAMVGEIVWSNAHFCGVEFERRLSDAELGNIIARPEDVPEDKGELEMF